MSEGDRERARARYEAMKEDNKDWIGEASRPRPRRDDGYPEGLPFDAFDSTEDVKSIEERTIKETREQWKDESPSELEHALHRFERRRKAAGENAADLYENRVFQSDVELARAKRDEEQVQAVKMHKYEVELARVQLRNWFAWNWKMRAVKKLLLFKDLEGPQAASVEPLRPEEVSDTAWGFLRDVAALYRDERRPMPESKTDLALAVVNLRIEKQRDVTLQTWPAERPPETNAEKKDAADALIGGLNRSLRGAERRPTGTNAEKARMIVHIASATFPVAR